jgi:hypothetical protein
MLQELNHLTLSVSCLETSFNFSLQDRLRDRHYSRASDYTHIAFTVSLEALHQYGKKIPVRETRYIF